MSKAMRKIVYAVYWRECDDILQSELDNIFPTAESAIRLAKKIGQQKNIYEVSVSCLEVTEEYGMHCIKDVYRETHKERLGI